MLEVIAELILKEAPKAGIDNVEAFLQRKTVKKISINNSMIKVLSESEKSGIAVRSILDKKLGFVATNSSTNIEDIIELSAQNASSSKEHISGNFTDRRAITKVEGIRDNQIREINLETIGERVVEILKSIDESKPVKKIDSELLLEIEERLIVNSSGIWKREVNTRQSSNIEVTIQVGNFLGIGSKVHHTHQFYDEWQELFNSAIRTAYSQQGRKKLSIDKPKGVILSPRAFGQILAFSFIPNFYINNERNFASIESKRNYSSNIQMIDDPTYPNGYNTFGFDDEGHPSKSRVVLNNGKPRRLLGMNFVYSSFDPRISYRGNCYRVTNLSHEKRSYTYSPVVSASNFIIQSKRNAVEDIFNELGNGIYIKDITGAQDANYFTGDFVVTVVEGYEVEKGEITNPILPCFCTGNIHSILEDSNLLLSKKKEEIVIPATPLSVISPELLTTRLTINI